MIEKDVADLLVAVTEAGHPFDARPQIGVGAAQVRAERPEAGVTAAILDTEDLDERRVEAHRQPTLDLDHDPR